MKALIRFFAREHLFSNLLTIMVLVLGIFSANTIRRDIWPKVEFYVTTVMTILPGASPEQIEKLIVNPVESVLKEVDGVKKISSTATENNAVTVLELDADARDTAKTNSDIQRTIDRIDDLPSDAEKPTVTVIDSGVFPVIEVTVGGTASDEEVRDAAKFIADDLSLLSDVARVTKQGFRKKEYLIEPTAEALARRQLGLTSVLQAISSQNVSSPSGSMKLKGGIEQVVKVDGQYKNIDEIKQTYVRANASGFGTRIGDIASVKRTLAEPELLYRANQKSSVNMIVSKKENADVLDLVAAVKKRVGELSEQLPETISLGFSNDFSVYLTKRLAALGWNLVIGLVLVVLILSLFLPWQVTLVVAVGIPVALLATIAVTFLSGLSINLLSLIGLIIVLGMLVDDAIVVSENVWRHIEEGDDDTILEAVVNGTREVLNPVLASIMTTVSAFAPMLFMTGIFGSFVFEIPLMVILALAFSFLEVFLIMPAHFVSWVGSSAEKHRAKNRNVGQKKHWFNKVVVRYEKFIRISLRRRYVMLMTLIGIFVATITLLVATGRFVLFPAEGVELFFAKVEAPVGVSLETMQDRITPIEKQIHEIVGVDLLDTATSVGIIQQDNIDPLTRRGSNFANIRVTLTPQTDRNNSADDIMDRLRENLVIPDGISDITYEPVSQGPPQGRPISIDFLGPDFETLKKMADEFKTALAEIEGVKDPKDSYVLGKKEWQVIPRNLDLASTGLTTMDVSQTLRAAFAGVVASSVRTLDEEVDVRVKLKKQAGSVEEQLKQLKIGNRQGNLIQLSSVADFKTSQGLTAIKHSQFKRVVNVSANVDVDKITAGQANAKAAPILEAIAKKYPGYTYGSSGEDKDTEESMASLGRAFGFAALFILSLLIITFKNLFQPFLILFSVIPLGFIGVVFAMFLHGRPMSFMAMLGVIALAGVIVNNAIVFTDFVNRKRDQGGDLDESIISAATTRLRPIVLTTLTTICGLLPTAYGDTLRDLFGIGGGDPFIIPIALALGWGLAFGSLLTGLFFPALLRVLDDVRGLFSRRSKGKLT